MAHHDSTPRSVLTAPRQNRLGVWITHHWKRVGEDKPARWVSIPTGAGPFTGDVERDLVGSTVGLSRKGRKIRRPSTLVTKD